MGIIGRVFGRGGVKAIGDAVTDVAEVFTPNATRRMELGHEAFVASVNQHGTEFSHGGSLLFDRFINGLNRLPRPMLALGTLGLFIHAMVDPISFAARMEGLAYVPDPLWWLLGAIVSFYFGAREVHYRRSAPTPPSRKVKKPVVSDARGSSDNPALTAWKSSGDE
jgi:hypothetical protein